MAEEATRSPEERKYLERVSAAYSEVGPLALQGEGQKDTDLVEFMVQLFDYQIEYSLGDNLDKQRVSQLLDLRAVAEKSRIQIENEWAERKMGVSEFVVMSDLQAILFQKDAARALTSNQYEALFGLNRGEFVALADPGIVATAYRQQELY
jgi:hypothetical protein